MVRKVVLSKGNGEEVIVKELASDYVIDRCSCFEEAESRCIEEGMHICEFENV